MVVSVEQRRDFKDLRDVKMEEDISLLETRPLTVSELNNSPLATDSLGRISHARSNLIALLASGLCGPFSSVTGSARGLLRVCNQLEQELLTSPPVGKEDESVTHYRRVLNANITGLELLVKNLMELACTVEDDVADDNETPASFRPLPASPAPDPPVSATPFTPHPRRLLIVDDEHEIATLFSTYLAKRHGYDVRVLTDGHEVVETARTFQPHLVLLDLMLPGVDGYALCQALKRNRATASIPVVLLTGQGETERLIRGIEAGADDYLLKPVHMAELQARLELVMQRLERARQASPLTGLPGNVIIEREVETRIRTDARFAVCYSDLANFKAFNDTYGYVHGDRVLKWLAQIICATIDELGDPSDFVGHVGGDDFIVVTAPERVKAICSAIIARFDETIPSFYNAGDRAAGFITANNRSDVLTTFPIMTISIAVVTNTRRPLTTLAQVSEASSSIKRYLKTLHGSHFMVDRRSKEDSMSTPLITPTPVEKLADRSAEQ